MTAATASKNKGPLHGIKVLDLTRILAGPWASQLLADYGADVIKIERPRSGDDTRAWGPPWLSASTEGDAEDSAYFLSANRNKRSVTVNLDNPAGAALVCDLARTSDVFLENFKVGTCQRFGLDYPTLSAANPALVYCSISAYGQSGSRSGEPGYDAVVQAAGGLMSITGAPDEEGGSPQKVGVAIADIMAGMYAASGVLAAIVSQQRTGQGQFIDVPLYDSQVAWLANQNMNYLIGGKVPGRMGTAHPNLVPYQAFPTRDGYVMLAVGNDRQFRSCLSCIGHAELCEDPRFATNAGRIEHRKTLVDILTAAFHTRSTSDWLQALAAHSVPSGPINSIDTVLTGDYAAERQLVRSLPNGDGSTVPTVANPVRFSVTPVSYRLAPPRLGDSTVEVLQSRLGLSPAEIATLSAKGAI